jgi:hypothetical protein
LHQDKSDKNSFIGQENEKQFLLKKVSSLESGELKSTNSKNDRLHSIETYSNKEETSQNMTNCGGTSKLNIIGKNATALLEPQQC